MHQLGCAVWLEASFLKSKVRPPPGVTPTMLYLTRGEFLDICKTMSDFAEIAYCKAALDAQREFFEQTSEFDSAKLTINSEGYPMFGHLLHAAIITSAGEEL